VLRRQWVGKKSRKPKYFDCPVCCRKLRLNGVKIPLHKRLDTLTLCPTSGNYVPEVKK